MYKQMIRLRQFLVHVIDKENTSLTPTSCVFAQGSLGNGLGLCCFILILLRKKRVHDPMILVIVVMLMMQGLICLTDPQTRGTFALGSTSLVGINATMLRPVP